MMADDETDSGLVALLGWYKAMGVDTAISEVPVDWLERGDAAPGVGFALPAPRPQPASNPSPRAAAPSQQGPAPVTPPRRAEPRALPVAPPDEAVLAARTAARSARTLDELEANLRAFDGCGLKASAKNLCFFRGSAKARLLIIGEAPGRDEDLEGRPFVGKAGKLLDLMLKSIGLDEADVHITNIVYWRPPGNRTPTPQEALSCRPFLERQVELVAPEFVLLLGGAAAKAVLDVEDGIMRIRGKWRDLTIGGHAIRALATLHPAYLLRTPAAKRLAWRDLLMVKSALAGQLKS